MAEKTSLCFRKIGLVALCCFDGWLGLRMKFYRAEIVIENNVQLLVWAVRMIKWLMVEQWQVLMAMIWLFLIPLVGSSCRILGCCGKL